MKKNIIIFILFISFVGMTSVSDFDKYINSLDKIKLPLTIGSDGLDYHYGKDKHFDTTLFKKYKHEWSVAPIGLLCKSDLFVSTIEYIIGDGVVPVIMTYDIKGDKIDSLIPYQHTGSDSVSQTTETVIINSCKDIFVIDSNKRWTDWQSKLKRIDGVMKFAVDTTFYYIDKIGKIKKKK